MPHKAKPRKAAPVAMSAPSPAKKKPKKAPKPTKTTGLDLCDACTKEDFA